MRSARLTGVLPPAGLTESSATGTAKEEVMVSTTQMRIRRAIPEISLPLPALEESATLSHGVPQTAGSEAISQTVRILWYGGEPAFETDSVVE